MEIDAPSPGRAEVDAKLPAARTAILGFQHVLAMYAGAVAVPLVLGAALRLTKPQLALLISADLFTCGIATFIQTLGLSRSVGIRMPVMMGVTMVAVGPMINIGQAFGLQYIYGSIIISGLMVALSAGVFCRLLRFFPDLVTGSIITIVGLSLIPVAAKWAAGGAGAADYGSGANLCLSAGVLGLIIVITRYASPFIASVSVLIGLLAGFAAAHFMGKVSLDAVGLEPWFALPSPFWFGPPKFNLVAILSMVCIAAICMVESTGVFFGIGRVTGVEIKPRDVARGLRAEGIAAVIGSVFNSFPYITFGQNLGLVALTKVKSRYVVAAGGGILVLLGTLPKLAALVASIPPPVLGGAGLAVFGMVAASGIAVLARVDFTEPVNLFIAAVSLAVGVAIPMEPELFKSLGPTLRHFFSNGVLMGSAAAVSLNWLFNLRKTA